MQQGLAHWHTFLLKKSLPILGQTKKEVQALIDQPQLSITQYSGPIFFDAGLSTVLFQHVNGLRQSSNKNPLTTLSNVLSYLGQAAFQSFLNKALTLENLNLPEKNKQGFMRVMGQACHASLQSREWGVQRSALEMEAVQLAALLQNLTELMLWCYADDVMPKIEELYYVNHLPYEQAALKVLGCDMRALGAALADSWNLPEIATQGLKTQQDDFTLATGVFLASELARTVACSWYGKQTVGVISRIARYKGKAEGEIERRLHLVTVNINDILIGKGYEAPAKNLFQLVDDDYQYLEFVIHKAVEKQPEDKYDQMNNEVDLTTLTQKNKMGTINKKIKEVAKTKSSDARKAILDKIKARKLAEKLTEEKQIEQVNPPVINEALIAAMKEFKILISNKCSNNELIEFAVNMCLLIGVQRCVFLIKPKNKNILVSKASAEAKGSPPINNFNVPLDHPHLFKRLLEKNSSLYLNGTNYSKYWSMIPERVKLVLGVKHFFASSIFINHHAVGVVYADKLKGSLTQTEFIQFKHICQLLSKGIEKNLTKKKI